MTSINNLYIHLLPSGSIYCFSDWSWPMDCLLGCLSFTSGLSPSTMKQLQQHMQQISTSTNISSISTINIMRTLLSMSSLRAIFWIQLSSGFFILSSWMSSFSSATAYILSSLTWILSSFITYWFPFIFSDCFMLRALTRHSLSIIPQKICRQQTNNISRSSRPWLAD